MSVFATMAMGKVSITLARRNMIDWLHSNFTLTGMIKLRSPTLQTDTISDHDGPGGGGTKVPFPSQAIAALVKSPLDPPEV